MTARKFSLVFLTCIALGFVSCDIDVPIQDMVKARSTIEKARTVRADTYDPENLAKAEDWLKKSHDYCVAKDEKNAKSAAERSVVYGDMALQASLPKAAEESLAEARSVVEEADKLNAEQFAPEQFVKATGAFAEAEKLKTEDNLWDAYLKAKEATGAGTEAKEKSLEQVPGLNERLGMLKKEIDTLNAAKLPAEKKKEVAAADANLNKAAGLIVQNNLKAAVPLMDESEKTIGAVKAAFGKTAAKELIAKLRKEAEQLRKARGSEFAGDDIDAVITTLNEADALLEQDKLDDANDKINDAERSLTAAKEKTTRGLALDKAKSVEKLLEEVKQKDTQNKFKTETDNAAAMISDGNKLLESASYKESLVKFEEAESLLYSLGIAKEKEALKEEGVVPDAEGKRIYQVVYNRKKRDCLWRIADKMYKDARLWPLIYMANKDQIKDPDLIFPGQRFVIPEVPKKKPEKTEKDESSAIREDTKAVEGEGDATRPDAETNDAADNPATDAAHDTVKEDTVEEDMTE